MVALDLAHDELVFVEVKTRSSGQWGNPSLAVDRRKLKAMEKAAIHYLQAKRLNRDFRFDVISLLPNKIDHFENITW